VTKRTFLSITQQKPPIKIISDSGVGRSVQFYNLAHLDESFQLGNIILFGSDIAKVAEQVASQQKMPAQSLVNEKSQQGDSKEQTVFSNSCSCGLFLHAFAANPPALLRPTKRE
jgi:hypothetical protein